jgi:hypothetical protein
LDTKKLVAGGIVAVMVALGGNEVQNTLERNALVAEFKQPVMVEYAKKQVGQELKSLRTTHSETFKSDSVWTHYKGLDGKVSKTDSFKTPSFTAHVYATQKYWMDADADTLRPIDITVHEISALAKLNPLRTHDKYIDSGNFQAQWKNDKPHDFRMDAGETYIKYTALHDTTGITVKTEPTANGMKETITLSGDKSAHELKWRVETNGNLVAGVGNMVRIRASDGTYPMEIAPPKAWDKAGKPVMAVASVSGDTLTFRVTVLPGQEYPVMVDPSTTVVDVDALTGYLGVQEVVAYDENARNVTSAQFDQAAAILVGQYKNVGGYSVFRSVFRFGTSSMPAMSSIDSAKVRVVIETDNSAVEFDMRISDTTDSLDTGHLNTSMYNEFKGWASSGAYSPTYLSDDVINTSGKSVGDTLTYKFNAAGLANINTSGTTQFFMLSEEDVTDSAPVVNEYIAVGDDSPYLQIWYVAPYEPVPTAFTLSSPTTTSLYASWINHHSTNIDSLRIFTGAGAWYKTLAKTDQNTTISGLSINTQYTFKARVDSGGVSNYSNSDTLYTLAAAPSDLAFTFSDSTIATATFETNSNPVGTLYALRDSTLQKWFGGDGIADSSDASWLTNAQWEALTLQLVTNNIIHLIGVVAKNGDGVQTTYDWITATTGNVYTRTITATVKAYYNDPTTTPYTAARNMAIEDSLGVESVPFLIVGQFKPSNYYVSRVGMDFLIPRVTTVTADSLILTADTDESDSSFTFVLVSGFWHAALSGIKTPFYTFDGWATGAHTGTNLLETFSSASYATTMRIPMNAASKDSIKAASQDTSRFILTTSRDYGADDTGSVNSYIRLSAAPQLKIIYTLLDAPPTSVVVTSIAGATDSILVTWTDNSLTETGFALVNAYTGARLGGNDSTAADAQVKRMGGRTPNTKYNIAIKVLGGKIADSVSTAQDSTYTRAAVLPKPTVSMVAGHDSLRKIVIDTTGIFNPQTRIALEDSVLHRFVKWISGAHDTLAAGTDSSNADYRTFANWGGANGDTVKYTVGKTSAFRVWTKNSQ